MPLLSHLKQTTNNPTQTNKPPYYGSITQLNYFICGEILLLGLWVTLSLLECAVGLGLLSIIALSSIMTILPLISQSSLRLEFPGSCFSCYSPQNTNISSYSMWIHHYSMISGQEGAHGAGYWEVNDTRWKSRDEPPLCASVVLKMAMLTSVHQCRRFHWPILYGDSFLWKNREKAVVWGPGCSRTISVHRDCSAGGPGMGGISTHLPRSESWDASVATE